MDKRIFMMDITDFYGLTDFFFMNIDLYDLRIIMEMDYRNVMYMWILIKVEVDRLLKNNKCMDLPIVSVENFGTLEFLAPSSCDVDKAPKRPSNFENESTLTGTNIGNPPVEDLCKHFYKGSTSIEFLQN